MLSPEVVRYLSLGLFILLTLGTLDFLRRSRRGPRPAGERAATEEDRWAEWSWLILVIGVGPALFLVAVLAPGLMYGSPWNLALPGDTVVQVIGLATWVLGAFLVSWAGQHLGRYMRVRMAVAVDQPLVATGPYRRIRHPTYAGDMAMAWGLALLFLHPVPVLAALGTTTLAFRRARKEEALLGRPEAFGGPYQEYTKRTGRFLPRFPPR